MRIVCTILFLTLLASMRISAQSETSYDIEHECICLIDSIAPDTIVQFWRFTQANNPGEYTVDVTFDFGGAYLPSGTLLSCKDYYLGDNPGGSGTAGTLTIWTGTSSLGNSNVTESGQILSSSFTGAIKPPAGTTVQQPAGSPGYFRFNTTASGFEGYNGSAYRFLPWASADNFTTGSIPYSDGNQLIQDNSKLFYSSGSAELRINRSSDAGAYTLQVGHDSGTGGVYVRQGPIYLNEGGYTFGALSTYIDASAVSYPSGWLRIKNTEATAGYGARIEGIQGALFVRQTSGTVPPLAIRSNAGSASATTAGLNFTTQDSPTDAASVTAYAVGGGTGITWTYYKPLPVPAANLEVGRVRVITSNWNNGDANKDTQLENWILVNGTLTNTFQQDSLGLKASLYGSGSITGTTAYYNAWTSSGRMIEKSVANVLSDLGIAHGAISTSTDGSGDIVVAHGMGTTPTSVQVTITGTTPYVVTVHTIGATNFTVRFFDMAGAAVASTAVTATWHAKT